MVRRTLCTLLGLLVLIFGAVVPEGSVQAQGVADPIKLTVLYQKPVYPNGTPLTNQGIANTFNYVIYHPGFATDIRDYRVAGWNGQAMMYQLLNGMNGPIKFRERGYRTAKCDEATDTELSFSPLSNNIMGTKFASNPTTHGTNDFCKLHNAIVDNETNSCNDPAPPAECTGYDHDWNTSTPNVFPTEDWFLHVGSREPGVTLGPLPECEDLAELVPELVSCTTLQPERGRTDVGPLRISLAVGDRVVESTTHGDDGAQFRPNPGNPHVREMYAARVRKIYDGYRTLNGTTIFNGVFLDNIEFHGSKLIRNAGHRLPAEYESLDRFEADVYLQAQGIDRNLPTTVPLWGNMIEDFYTPNGWMTPNNYDVLLEGAMQEFFSLNFNGGWYADQWDEYDTQRTQADAWIKAGNHYFAVAPNDRDAAEYCPGLSDFDDRGTLALTHLMMVTDGYNTSFFHNDQNVGSGVYNALPGYEFHLGAPLQQWQPIIKGGTFHTMAREFQYGKAYIMRPTGFSYIGPK